MRLIKRIYIWLCENEFKIFAIIAFTLAVLIWLYLLITININDL